MDISSLTLQAVPGYRGPARPPGSLYNGMIAPMAPYGIRGVLWYQGEGNAGRAYQYRTLLPAMIKSWRKTWDQGDFPFLIVQLPNFKPRRDVPVEDNWAELREAQLMALQVTGTGLAITIDLGNPLDVHPSRKYEVGRRLALWALGTEYEKDIVYSGPLYESMEIKDGLASLKFIHTGDSLIAKDGPSLRGFAMAGEDGKFYWAEAKIVNQEVILTCDKVPSPVAVRYGWQGNPDCNLYNSANLPASPFRSDQWPGITVNKQ